MSYFSYDMLSGALGKDGMKQLEEMAINSGTAFMSGQVTNIAFKATTNKTTSTLIAGAATGLGTYVTAKEMWKNKDEIISSLSETIVGTATQVITKEMTQLTTGYLAKHAQALLSFPTQVNSYALAYFNEHKASVNDVLKTLTESAEERMEKLNEENNKKEMSDFSDKSQKDSKSFIEKMNKSIATGTSYISTVTSYLQNGPDWVIDQMDKQISSLLEGAYKEVNQQWEKDQKEYNEKVKTTGTKLGKQMVEKYNNSLKNAQKKGLEKISKMKTKSGLKTFSAKAKASAAIAAKTGIYIPM